MPVTHRDNSVNADAAARKAGVEIRELSSIDEIAAVRALLDEIWQPGDDSDPPVGTEIIRAMTHAGNYLAGAYDEESLLGATIGFFGSPPGQVLHSHVTGVVAQARGRNVGYALKQHQAAWALRRGLTTITWTFDPLVQRNAYFNLTKLGATASEYHVDFYGDVDDAVNGGQGSDRLVAHWQLDDGPSRRQFAAEAIAVAVDTDERPVVADNLDRPNVLVQIPSDIEQMRADVPKLAREWRHVIRDVFGELLADGAKIVGLSPEGHYQVTRTVSV